MQDRFRGITDSEIQWDGRIPTLLTMTLNRGQKVQVDLVTRQLQQLAGKPLKEKQQAWVQHMADYLLRQALLKRQEEEHEAKIEGSGHQPLTFTPRIDPNVTWWG
ncbi:hypothetical protein Mmc1_3701 [Magnetococcus marinus MC-1]|uniref:Uncharacterized protein n=1 Tax=Magnetococcus marinus (strain ATCC BAA-1437 / JCM 17883 / MC-1) TaxID=156889 RepID=A0LDZ3_MAGMM|nr:hypothetical protein [Magnetococcus marinus]ABK46186.1 hypothetical protein Mmc1_3701 [Magnetococcus marinus MC-1]